MNDLRLADEINGPSCLPFVLHHDGSPRQVPDPRDVAAVVGPKLFGGASPVLHRRQDRLSVNLAGDSLKDISELIPNSRRMCIEQVKARITPGWGKATHGALEPIQPARLLRLTRRL